MRLVLASASPQRKVLLEAAGFEFDAIPADVPEIESGLDPEHIALVNAEAKAREVFRQQGADAVVIGADTVVDVSGVPLGQPADRAEAEAHLRSLSGQPHEVHTGVSVVTADGERSGIASTRVVFRTLTDDEITAYLDSGEWRGRAGGYAIQENGDRFATAIEGDFDNVVGLPLGLVVELLPETVQPD